MNRGPIAAIQRRKFRLLIRWRIALKDTTTFRLMSPARFPTKVVFRAFDEVLRLMRLAAADSPMGHDTKLLATTNDAVDLSPDQFMDVFLVGRAVLADFLASDPKLVGKYHSEVRNHVRHALDHAVRHLVEREMREYSRIVESKASAPNEEPAPRGRPARVEAVTRTARREREVVDAAIAPEPHATLSAADESEASASSDRLARTRARQSPARIEA